MKVLPFLAPKYDTPAHLFNVFPLWCSSCGLAAEILVYGKLSSRVLSEAEGHATGNSISMKGGVSAGLSLHCQCGHPDFSYVETVDGIGEPLVARISFSLSMVIRGCHCFGFAYSDLMGSYKQSHADFDGLRGVKKWKDGERERLTIISTTDDDDLSEVCKH